jgi:archaellum biogenesis ATPase FlaH
MGDQLVLISGQSATGKSASLRDLTDHKSVMYLGTEAGKKLPFKNRFKKLVVTDPNQILSAFDAAETMSEINTIVVDSLTFMMDQYESLHVLGVPDTMKGWSNYQQFFKELMQQKVANSSKTVLFTAHTQTIYNEGDMVMETKVPVKGALKANGIESYFSTVVSTKKLPIKALEGYENSLLKITEEEELLGYKYVYQTKLTKDTVNERIRSPMGMFDRNHTYIDNNAQYLIEVLTDFYAEEEE